MKKFISACLAIVLIVSNSFAQSISDKKQALLYSVFQLELNTLNDGYNPYYQTDLEVTFTRPDESKVTADGFYDGGLEFKARAYCDQIGTWQWQSNSNDPDLDGHSGNFEVVPSDLLGKLRISTKDPYQFAYDNGDWFLHIGDTGYRFLIPSEPLWREYIDQAAEMGATKIRAWFAMKRGTVEDLFTANQPDIALHFWREMEKRILYTLDNHPQINIQLIPFAEDTERIKAYARGDSSAQLILEYAQARWSSFPNIQWTLSNDRKIITSENLTGREIHPDMIDQMGADADRQEPWNTLITNHQSRFSGYDFVDAEWSDIITVEDLDQVGGEVILEFRKKGKQPIVLDEDRYERYRYPAHPRYYFRRLMWASLLSGGHATYGGLRTYEPYNGQAYTAYGMKMEYQPNQGLESGVSGYFDANRAGILRQGGHDFRFIHQFFQDAGITLENMESNDEMAGNQPLQYKCMQGKGYVIAYLANPSGTEPGTDFPSLTIPKIDLSLTNSQYLVKWFDPDSGNWTTGSRIEGPSVSLQAPGSEDWILLLEKID